MLILKKRLLKIPKEIHYGIDTFICGRRTELMWLY